MIMQTQQLPVSLMISSMLHLCPEPFLFQNPPFSLS